jgi:hypothetical protein
MGILWRATELQLTQMESMKPRTLRATAIGLLAGLLISILGWIVMISAFIWDNRRRMSDLSDEPAYFTVVWRSLTHKDSLPYWAVVAALGVNGGIGGWSGCRTGRKGIVPVLWVALLPFLFPLAVYAENPAGGSKSWGGAFVVALFIIPFVWVAGRVGQELGVRQRKPESHPAA